MSVPGGLSGRGEQEEEDRAGQQGRKGRQKLFRRPQRGGAEEGVPGVDDGVTADGEAERAGVFEDKLAG